MNTEQAEECVIKKVGLHASTPEKINGQVYLPRAWIGKKVKCTLIEEE